MEAVGLGCFWFARTSAAMANDPEKYFPGDHLEDIRSALESVDNISNVEIIGDGSTISGTIFDYVSDDDEEEKSRLFQSLPSVQPRGNFF